MARAQYIECGRQFSLRIQETNKWSKKARSEKSLYLQFIQRLDAAGALREGEGARIIEDLRQAMKSQGPFG